MKDVYAIRGREYDIKNIAENENVGFVEMVESYPDPDTGQVYRTPLILVLEMKDGKIKTGRHYCDPNLSYENLSVEDVKKPLNKKSLQLQLFVYIGRTYGEQKVKKGPEQNMCLPESCW